MQQLAGDGGAACGWEEDAGEWIGGGGIDVSQCWGEGQLNLARHSWWAWLPNIYSRVTQYNMWKATWGRGTTPETTSLNPGEIDGGNWSCQNIFHKWHSDTSWIAISLRYYTWWDTLARPSPGGGNLSEVQDTDRSRSEGSLSDTCINVDDSVIL